MTIFILTIMFSALIATAAGLVWSIGANLRQGRTVREELAARLEGLRLSEALRQRDVDPRAYVHRQPLVAVERHLRACEGCGAAASCDEVLDRGAYDADMGFCPNDRAIDALSPARA